MDDRHIPRGLEYATSRTRLFNPANYGFVSKIVELPLTTARQAELVGIKRPFPTNVIVQVPLEVKQRREEHFVRITAEIKRALMQNVGLPLNLINNNLQVSVDDLTMYEDWASAYGYVLHHVIQHNNIVLVALN